MMGNAESTGGFIGRIPVQNLWLLMLYASELFRAHGPVRVGLDETPDDIPDLIAEILAHAVSRRLRQNLSRGYVARDETLNRVRGRIDVLRTERRQLLTRAKVACRFTELTMDTPRNRLVRGALESIVGIVRRNDIAHRCRENVNALRRLGVSGTVPSRAELSGDRLGRNDSADRLMIAAAKLAFRLALPTENAGREMLLHPDRDEVWVRRLFEKAVGGLYRAILEGEGWTISVGKRFYWPVAHATDGIASILPSMIADIVLDHQSRAKRIVIDTKFAALLTAGWYREETLSSRYIYQMFAYLQSQSGSQDILADSASGLLLHPAIDRQVDETAFIHGHSIRFATVDLCASPKQIRMRLEKLVKSAAFD